MSHAPVRTQPRHASSVVIQHAALGFCGFVTIFGLAHLLLIDITKPSGYVFFATVTVVPLVIATALLAFAADRAAALRRFGFGALMCVCAIPFIYLARVVPASSRQTVRNIIGLPFLALAIAGPEVARMIHRQRTA